MARSKQTSPDKPVVHTGDPVLSRKDAPPPRSPREVAEEEAAKAKATKGKDQQYFASCGRFGFFVGGEHYDFVSDEPTTVPAVYDQHAQSYVPEKLMEWSPENAKRAEEVRDKEKRGGRQG
jgi:hypothetical protein